MSKHTDVVELTKRIHELEKELRDLQLDLGRLETRLITLLESDLETKFDGLDGLDVDTYFVGDVDDDIIDGYSRCEKCGRMVEHRLMNTYLGVCLECLRDM